MPPEPAPVEVDLTPMIDCTFLLIIFFMLVVKMSNDEMEPVDLPDAEEAEEDRSEDPGRLIINLREGPIVEGKPTFRVYVGGVDMTPAHSGGRWQVSSSAFERRLVAEADLGDKQFSERQVLIRADKDCPYEFVAMVMAALTRPGVKITKVQLGVKKGDG